MQSLHLTTLIGKVFLFLSSFKFFNKVFAKGCSPIFITSIRFEELQKGFDYVCGQIGKPKRLLERIGSSTHELYMNYYDTREKIELVNEYMKDYFEIYGYEKW